MALDSLGQQIRPLASLPVPISLGFASALVYGYVSTFIELIIARVFNGFFTVAVALGASTVTDLFLDTSKVGRWTSL